ncbi:MAG: 4,5-dihydroxyphthalate decarboxylase [Proteobacteria bacterium]|nr:4,5-dihydroxyphthalate decarboxylase [Pseudomonadota bacterium]
MELTIALNRYDRHVPFFNGTVAPPPGITFKPLEIGESVPFRDGTDRHSRLLNDLEFDIGEMGLSSFVMAVARDPNLAIVGIPSFPRRFFSAGQIYINPNANIRSPRDLTGKRIGVHSFQTTLSVLAKGDLKLEFGVNWEDIDWYCMRGEIVPVDLGEDVSVQVIPAGKDIGMMLMDGEIDALISPQPRQSMLDAPHRYRRLFDDPRAEEIRYFKKYGFYPIMHVMTLKRELAEARPDLPRALMDMCEAAKTLAYSFYDDSNYSLLAWSRNAMEEQRAALGADPWTSGFAANKKNLEQFIGYSHNQRLIDAPYPAENLFHKSVLDS